jgi:hypothetical protein
MYPSVLVHVKGCGNGWQTNSWTSPARKDSVVDHFQLSSQEFHIATSQARQKAVRADLRVTLLFSKEQLTGIS